MKNFLWILFNMVVGLLFFYIVGCFVAWSVNPSTWWIFTSIGGRIIFTIYFIILLTTSVKANEDFN